MIFNLTEASKLPAGMGHWRNNGKFCALGAACAAIYGPDYNTEQRDEFYRLSDPVREKSGVYGVRFDMEFRVGKDNQELLRKYLVRLADAGKELGVWEVV